jgi:SAM-dependent methyltransferase
MVPAAAAVRRQLRAVLLRAARYAEQVGNALRYAGAGTMRMRELRAGIEREFGVYYESDREIGSGLFDWEADIVERFIQPSHRILLVGSGTGRDLLPLAAMGCRVTGIEPVARAVDFARRAIDARGLDAALVCGYFEDVPIDGRFDVIDFSHGCYSFMPGAARRVEALRKAVRHLEAGGIVVLSVLSSPDVPRTRSTAIGRAAGSLCRSDWRIEDGDFFERLPATDLARFGHLFGPGEVEAEAAAAGLRVVFRNYMGMVLRAEPA